MVEKRDGKSLFHLKKAFKCNSLKHKYNQVINLIKIKEINMKTIKSFILENVSSHMHTDKSENSMNEDVKVSARDKPIQNLIDRINDALGNPKKAYNDEKDNEANVNHWYLSGQNGMVGIYQIVNTGGGVRMPLGGFMKRSELQIALQSFLTGLNWKK